MNRTTLTTRLRKALRSRTTRHAAIVLVGAALLFGLGHGLLRKEPAPPPAPAPPPRPWNFDDNQPLHIEAAERLGIAPLDDRKAVGDLPDSIVRIGNCEDYEVAGLSHSVPYLTRGAATLLADLGRSFRLLLRRQGYREHRIVVTSVLRTRKDVERLQRHNANSTANSAHLYATTFDVSYRRFVCASDSGKAAPDSLLDATLGQVLRQLHAQGRCYVKREMRQPCFHVTTRK